MTKDTLRLPDFLLIGAAKAGTTALFTAMARHPLIHRPEQKEPLYLSYPDRKPSFIGPGAEANISRITWRRDDYLALFSDCPAACITGEASAQYLADASAPAPAWQLVPHARLIAILRHPVERAFSQYLHMRQEGKEPAASFEEAWNDGDRRKAQGWRPAYWHRHRGFYARHLSCWLEHFPQEQLLILFYEDWRDHPADVLAQVWSHLGLEALANPVVTQENVSSRQPRWSWLHHQMVNLDHPVRRLAQRTLPLWARDAVTHAVGAVNLRPGPRLDPTLRASLARTYHEDLTQLEARTGRDLTHWRT
jgi:hypothetical protein